MKGKFQNTHAVMTNFMETLSEYSSNHFLFREFGIQLSVSVPSRSECQLKKSCMHDLIPKGKYFQSESQTNSHNGISTVPQSSQNFSLLQSLEHSKNNIGGISFGA